MKNEKPGSERPSKPKLLVNGVDIDVFIDGKVNVKAPGVLHDKNKELSVWLTAMAVLKQRGYDPERVVRAFSRIPGFNEQSTRTALNYWWDKEGMVKRFT